MIVSNTQRHDHAFVHLYARTYLACNCKVAFDHCGHEGRQTRLWTMILQQICQRNSYRCGTKMISSLRVTGLESLRPAYALCNDLSTTFRRSCLQSDVRSVRQDMQKAVWCTAICSQGLQLCTHPHVCSTHAIWQLCSFLFWKGRHYSPNRLETGTQYQKRDLVEPNEATVASSTTYNT